MKFEVLHDGFSHEGKWYRRGEIVELDKGHGERLASEFGALRAEGEKPASSDSEPEPESTTEGSGSGEESASRSTRGTKTTRAKE